MKLNDKAIEHYATWVQKATITQLRQFPDPYKRYLHLLAFLQYQYCQRQDMLMDPLLKLILNAINTAGQKGDRRDLDNRLEQNTAIPSKDVRGAAWQQITHQWWLDEKPKYSCYISQLVIAAASGGNVEAAERRLQTLQGIPDLPIDEQISDFAEYLIAGHGIPRTSEADALHVAIAAIHRMDFLLTWNCRHINNATAKPVIRKLCEQAGYLFPEICTPLELLSEDSDYV